jgi:hypothetical protein
MEGVLVRKFFYTQKENDPFFDESDHSKRLLSMQTNAQKPF